MNDSEGGIGWRIAWERMAGVISRCMHVWLITSSPLMSAPPRQRKEKADTSIDERQVTAREAGALPGRGGGVTTEREAP